MLILSDVFFSATSFNSGGQVSHRQDSCEGYSNKVLLNTSRVTFFSCKVLHVGEDHLHEIVAFGIILLTNVRLIYVLG
jgi:hypothetical protein